MVEDIKTSRTSGKRLSEVLWVLYSSNQISLYCLLSLLKCAPVPHLPNARAARELGSCTLISYEEKHGT